MELIRVIASKPPIVRPFVRRLCGLKMFEGLANAKVSLGEDIE